MMFLSDMELKVYFIKNCIDCKSYTGAYGCARLGVPIAKEHIESNTFPIWCPLPDKKWGEKMKTIIAGSRTITDYSLLLIALKQIDWEITEVVCGEAFGVDILGRQWAEENGIPVRSFPAKWGQYGKSAGYIRNAIMAEYADALVVIWDRKSKGTRNMIDLAEKYGLKILKREWK